MHKAVIPSLVGAIVAIPTAAAILLTAGNTDSYARPNNALTPGKVNRTLTQDYLCTHSTDERRNVTTATKNHVYAEYNIKNPKPGQYEIDHRVPLWAGGVNDVGNLWPELNDHPKSALNTKDILERTLYNDVCRTHTVSLADAQAAFLGDWVRGYRRYVK